MDVVLFANLFKKINNVFTFLYVYYSVEKFCNIEKINHTYLNIDFYCSINWKSPIKFVE